MSAVARLRSQTALAMETLSLLAGCAVAAPNAANDPFFEENAGEDDLDASALDAEIDPNLVDPGALDSGNVLPPFGNVGGATLGGGAPGGTTGGGLPPARDASTSAPRDAATMRPPTTTLDATTPSSAACDPLACTNTCSVAGPFPCCTLFDTCGCTWAPGAYCI